MKNILKPALYLILGILIGIFLSPSSEDPNSKLIYGDSGLPKNCRAIIATNIAAYQDSEYSAEDILESIDRNCGKNGYSWDVE